MDLMSWPKRRRGAEESPPSHSSVWSELPLRAGPWAGSSDEMHVVWPSWGPCVGSEITDVGGPGPWESWAGSQRPLGAQKPTGISLMSWGQARWWAAPWHRGYSWAPGLGPPEKLLLLPTPALSLILGDLLAPGGSTRHLAEATGHSILRSPICKMGTLGPLVFKVVAPSFEDSQILWLVVFRGSVQLPFPEGRRLEP